MKRFIDLIPSRKKTVSPSDFLKMTEAEKRNVKSAKFVPPNVGSKSFGSFVIILKTPVYSIGSAEGK
jgi:hypothetical protein